MVSEKDFPLKPYAGFLLVAPKLKVMYCPTTKVACSSIKMLLAKASGSYDQMRLDRLISPHMARSQTIHELGVSGLTKLIDMSANEVDEILNSPDWLRVYATRDPLSRAYSAWENRIFSRAPGTPERAIELCQDVIVDGKVNVTESFALFAKMLTEKTNEFMDDHHFLPQSHIVHPDKFNYNMVARVEQPAEMQRLVDEVNRRAGTSLTLERHNVGFGIKLEQVCDQHTANRLQAVYEMDYQTFGFATRAFPASIDSLILTSSETAMLRGFRASIERLQSISFTARSLTGFRFGVRQIYKSIVRKISRGKKYNDPQNLFW
ncbi:MAG: sulfotransferase family 2 domain-containing protein [Acidimicrobiaceae bacterium]